MAGRGGKRPGAGRPPGSKNKLSLEKAKTLTELAGVHTEDALTVLAEIMNDKTATPAARVTAANSILDRAHGKPIQGIYEAPPGDAPPLSVAITALEAVGDVRVTKH